MGQWQLPTAHQSSPAEDGSMPVHEAIQAGLTVRTGPPVKGFFVIAPLHVSVMVLWPLHDKLLACPHMTCLEPDCLSVKLLTQSGVNIVQHSVFVSFACLELKVQAQAAVAVIS